MPHIYGYDPSGRSSIPLAFILDVAAVVVGVWALLARWTIDWPIGLAIVGGLVGAYSAVQAWRGKGLGLVMAIATIAACFGGVSVLTQ